MKNLWFFLLYLYSQLAFAQITETISSSFEYTQRIQQRLIQLADLEPTVYLTQIDSFRLDMERYFEHKKRVCEGDFSAVILGTAETESRTVQRLSREEKQLCYKELKALHVTYINNLFQAREKFLADLHKKRLEELKQARVKSLSEIEASSSTRR
jgi:hypothetical protein